MALGLCSGVFILVWKREIVANTVRLVGDHLAAMAPAVPRGAFIVVEPACPLPHSDIRREFVSVIRPYAAISTVVVFEGDGFFRAAVRGAVTSVSLLLGNPTHPHFVASVQEGAHFMQSELPGGIGAGELEAAVRTTRTAGVA
ncbi:MAG: hypothetical protein M3O46_07575 [Myxococcota bacterium]|nr:hypothetical protein [Myxococcota bacterium]